MVTATDTIRLFKVFMAPDASEAVAKVLESGYIGEGEKVAAFERTLGEFVGNPNVLAVNSGTSALMLALKCADVGYGDWVLSTPMTCLATNMAILATGANIEWVDVDPRTGLMDPADIDSNVSNRGLAADAIMCVHWGGQPCELDRLNAFGLPVIEDACQALGTVYKGAMVGNHSRFVCMSFQAIKTLTTGDGGAIFFERKEDMERARLMRWFGLDRKKSVDMRCCQDPPEIGYKMHMNDIAAAIGLANIYYLEENLDHMMAISDEYERAIADHPFLELHESKSGFSSNWLCTILAQDGDDAKAFIAYMRERGIECSKVHDRNDTKTIFTPFRRPLPGVEEFDQRHVCIPCGWWLSDSDVERVTDALRNYRVG